MARIMIIDDEPAMVDVISTIARERGHDPIPCNSGQRAIESLGTVAPEMVICDMKMEKVGGFVGAGTPESTRRGPRSPVRADDRGGKYR